MTPIPDAPATYRRREMRDRLQEVIEAVNNADLGGVDVSDLENQVKALESRKIVTKVIAGGANNVNLAVAGIDTEDELVSVVQLDLSAEEKFKGVEDLTAEASIPVDGNIKLTTTNTTGDKLLVTFVDIDGNA